MAYAVECNRPSAAINDVLDQNVERVLGSDRASTQLHTWCVECACTVTDYYYRSEAMR